MVSEVKMLFWIKGLEEALSIPSDIWARQFVNRSTQQASNNMGKLWTFNRIERNKVGAVTLCGGEQSLHIQSYSSGYADKKDPYKFTEAFPSALEPRRNDMHESCYQIWTRKCWTCRFFMLPDSAKWQVHVMWKEEKDSEGQRMSIAHICA